MSLCENCRHITPSKLRPWQHGGFNEGYVLHPDLTSLRASADECDLCRVFYHGIQAEIGRLGKDERTLSPPTRGLKIRGDQYHPSIDVNLLTGLLLDWAVDFTEIRFTISAPEDDPSRKCKDIHYGSVMPTALDHNNVRMMNDWIEDCSRSHPSCDTNQDGTKIRNMLPDRVLRISEDRCYLYEPGKGESAKYVALSHCWGEEQILRTLTCNVDEHRQSISHLALPRTFQDAISVTRLLGYSYLWIDSLCIIQDSASDWAMQSAKMADVYSNAFLTIAAASARNASEGLLNPRYRGSSAVVQYITDEGKQARVSVLNSRHLTANLYPMTLTSLSCRQGLGVYKSDSSQGGGNADWGLPFYYVWGKRHRKSSPQDPGYGWTEILQGYTGRKLRFESDKLPALSGMASEYARQVGDIYVAGLWRSQLPGALLWHTRLESKGASPLRLYNGSPTWSWSSVSGEVDLRLTQFVDRGASLVSIDFIKISLVNPENPYGQVEFGRITLTGHVIVVTCRSNYSIEGERYCAVELDSTVGWWIPDEATLIGDRHNMFAMAINKSPPGREFSPFRALLLERGDSEDEYRRIGCGEMWLEDEHIPLMGTQTLTIV